MKESAQRRANETATQTTQLSVCLKHKRETVRERRKRDSRHRRSAPRKQGERDRHTLRRPCQTASMAFDGAKMTPLGWIAFSRMNCRYSFRSSDVHFALLGCSATNLSAIAARSL